MFIIYPSNIDYLIDVLRLYIGDFEEKAYSDSILRTSLLAGIKMLQRRWNSKYLVLDAYTLPETLPEGYSYDPTQQGAIYVASGYVVASTPQGYGIIPDGLEENDVFRNPHVVFEAPTTSSVIVQEDEYPITIAAALMLFRSRVSSSSVSFQHWSDGEFNFSNVEASRAMRELLNNEAEQLEAYFKRTLAKSVVSSFKGSQYITRFTGGNYSD